MDPSNPGSPLRGVGFEPAVGFMLLFPMIHFCIGIAAILKGVRVSRGKALGTISTFWWVWAVFVGTGLAFCRGVTIGVWCSYVLYLAIGLLPIFRSRSQALGGLFRTGSAS